MAQRVRSGGWVEIDAAVGDAELTARLVANRSNRGRRTSRLVVRDACARVSTTPRVSNAELARFVAANLAWLRKTAERQRLERAARPAVSTYAPDLRAGGAINLLGRRYALALDERSERFVLDLSAGRLTVPRTAPIEGLTQQKVLELQLIAWIEEFFDAMLRSECAVMTPHWGVQPAKIEVADALSRWGSCSSRGVVRINWRLAFLPDICWRYVYAHELAHLTHFDHSAAFWALVRRYCPDVDKAREILARESPGRIHADKPARALLRRAGLGSGLFSLKTDIVRT